MAKMPKTEWVTRHHFAEVAEVLGIPTDMVMAMMEQRGQITVLFSKHYDPNAQSHEVWAAILERDPDGLAHLMAEQPAPGMWEEILAEMERELGDA